MSKKHVYSKDTSGFGDFVYVDLLLEVRRSRQFNINVILALLFAIVLGFFFIYRPYSAAIFDLEELNAINNDYEHELVLTQEEFTVYEIDLDAIGFEEDINEANQLRVDINNLVDDVLLKSTLNKGEIQSVRYNAETKQMLIEISIISQFSFDTLNDELLNLSWVEDVEHSAPTRYSNDVAYTSIFVIGVDYNVE